MKNVSQSVLLYRFRLSCPSGGVLQQIEPDLQGIRHHESVLQNRGPEHGLRRARHSQVNVDPFMRRSESEKLNSLAIDLFNVEMLGRAVDNREVQYACGREQPQADSRQLALRFSFPSFRLPPDVSTYGIVQGLLPFASNPAHRQFPPRTMIRRCPAPKEFLDTYQP